MKFPFPLAAASVLIASSMAVRANEPPSEAKAQPVDNIDKIVCVNERVTGSRMPRRVCHTKGEWEALKRGGSEATEKLQRQPMGPVEKGG